MKFENIKISDIVFVQESVSYGWNTSESFHIPKKVIRVTKTQFVVEGDRRFKKDGREMGYNKYSSAYFNGDKTYAYSNKIVKDQTQEKELFNAKVQLEIKIKDDLETLKISLNSDLNYEELVDLRNSITSIKEVLNINK